MTRIELLSRTGRTQEALIAIEHALGGAIGRERGADVLAIRGDIYSAQNRCDKAIEDYARAKQLGVHPSRIAAGEKRCKTAASPLATLPEKEN
jgi:tetratricopeptide (TPR) repeat protein